MSNSSLLAVKYDADMGEYFTLLDDVEKELAHYKDQIKGKVDPKKERENISPNRVSVKIPPLKIQGIKSKIVPAIIDNIKIDDATTWIEPFMGSGVVGFNVAPKTAIFSDINPYIIQFYNDLKSNTINAHMARQFLEGEAPKLANGDVEYYYEVRDRFNKEHNSLDFLFLNRACFNGVMRFNKKGNFNVPFCHKPNRFSKSYITKIINQIKNVENLIKTNDWKFICQPFEETIQMADNYDNSFIYCDPPYIDRNTDYYGGWNIDKETTLKNCLVSSKKRFMLSTWDYNKYRQNEYISTIWGFCNKINISHFYHVGAKESNREAIMEALLMNFEIDK